MSSRRTFAAVILTVMTALTVAVATPAHAATSTTVNVTSTRNAAVGINGYSLNVIDGKAYGWYIVKNETKHAKRLTVQITVDGATLTRTHKVEAFDHAYVTLDGVPVTAAQ